MTFAPASSFHLDTAAAPNVSFAVVGTGLVTARFAQEAACWIEFDSVGMEAAGGALDISISEGALPGEVYRIVPKRYGSLYRLETNNQLYGACA
jgi:hypothetical protein